MKTRTGLLLALALLVLLPTIGESASRGGRIGFGYSRFPIGSDLGTLRYDTYRFYFEGGFGVADQGESRFTFGSKLALKPWEYYGVPVEIGGSIAFITDGTVNDEGKAATLIDVGFFMGFSTLVTDQVAVGVALYPIDFGLGGAQTMTNLAAAAFNIHFLF